MTCTLHTAAAAILPDVRFRHVAMQFCTVPRRNALILTAASPFQAWE